MILYHIKIFLMSIRFFCVSQTSVIHFANYKIFTLGSCTKLSYLSFLIPENGHCDASFSTMLRINDNIQEDHTEQIIIIGSIIVVITILYGII